MTEKITREQFLAEVRQARQAWEATLAQIPAGQLQSPGVCGEWSVKDLVAHIAWYEAEMVGLIASRELAGSPWWNLPLTERNEAIHALYRDQPLPEVLADAGRIAADFLRGLEGLSDEDLNDPRRFANMPADWQPWSVIASNSSEHYQEHRAQLQVWMAQSGAAA